MTRLGTGPNALGRVLRSVLLAACAVVLTAGASADSFTDRVNAAFASVPNEKRSDLILLPAVAAMDPLPGPLTEDWREVLLTPASVHWPVVEEWAAAEPQQNALKVVQKIGEIEDFRRWMIFAQPYGVEAVPIEMISEQLYTELGDPPMLAAAKHLYLPKLDNLASLVQVQVTRHVHAGEFKPALELLMDWLVFVRSFADRPMYAEKQWAFVRINTTLDRIRDVAYTDSRNATRSLDAATLIGIIERLHPITGVPGLDRIAFPTGDHVAAEQLKTIICTDRGPVNPDTFGPTMARITTGERPLRAFAEAAYWEALRPGHAGWYELGDWIERIFNDWKHRWTLPYYDAIHTTPMDVTRLDPVQHAVLRALYDHLEGVREVRQIMAVRLAGTRTSLAVYGYSLRHNTFPPTLSAVRPDFVKALDNDPFKRNGGPLEYFVPVRDTPQPGRDKVTPHVIKIFLMSPYPSFELPLGNDQFVVYSVDRDETRDLVKFAIQGHPDYDEGDYLIWPPITSLVRQHMMDAGLLE